MDGPLRLRHLRDPPNARFTQPSLLRCFQLLSSGRPGSLRRAHSEELMSEVGVVAAANNTNGSNSDDVTLNGDLDNAHCYGGGSYKGLQVSDRPSNYASLGRRVRRNSAGDEISSILDHEATTATSNGLVVVASPLAAFNTRDMAPHSYHNQLVSSSGAT